MMGRGKAGAYRAFVTCTVDDIVLPVQEGVAQFTGQLSATTSQNTVKPFTDFHFLRTVGSTMLPVSLEAWEALQPYQSKH